MTQSVTREEIAANVRAAMARRRVGQQAIGDVIGKSRSVASTRVNGESHFRIDELQKVAAFLQVPLEQLLAPASTEASA